MAFAPLAQSEAEISTMESSKKAWFSEAFAQEAEDEQNHSGEWYLVAQVPAIPTC